VTKRTLTTALARVVNPVVRAAIRLRLLRGWALLETRGRKSGLPRTTPVGNGLVGDTFWIVAEHGRRAAYVRNIEANPRVRVRARGRWRSGTAVPMPNDDPIERQRLMGERNWLARSNARAVRTFGTDLLTVRVDLDR
jgi:deazaflavin-dependent oxidoreductase (nitroreductase family)